MEPSRIVAATCEVSLLLGHSSLSTVPGFPFLKHHIKEKFVIFHDLLKVPYPPVKSIHDLAPFAFWSFLYSKPALSSSWTCFSNIWYSFPPPGLCLDCFSLFEVGHSNQRQNLNSSSHLPIYLQFPCYIAQLKCVSYIKHFDTLLAEFTLLL